VVTVVVGFKVVVTVVDLVEDPVGWKVDVEVPVEGLVRVVDSV